MLVACLLVSASGASAAASKDHPYIAFKRVETYKAFSAGEKDAVTVGRNQQGPVVKLGSSPHQGTDNSGKYNGGRYYWGSLTSPVYRPNVAFDTLNPSWNAATPDGTWLQMQVRVRSHGKWTRWFNLGIWAKGTTAIKRHSVNGQKESGWQVATDTLQSGGNASARAYQYRLTLFTEKKGLSPGVRALFFTASNSHRNGDSLGVKADKALWGEDLAVPRRSQMIYPNGGEVWCSPTSLSMVMAYWAQKTGDNSLDQPVPKVAHGTYDYVYQGNGNWPFNTGYAASYGLKASVNKFSSISQVERWVHAGVPVVASVAWNKGELDNAPIPYTAGHLLVIRGFTKSGDVIVNDPAAKNDSGVRRVYKRDQFHKVWFKTGSGGIAYLVYPQNWRIPSHTYAHGSW